jgi:predicted DNA-binding transcriptional regulator YafY
MQIETNWDNFFRTMVGVKRLKNTEVKKIVLCFYNGREKFFKTKPFLPDFEEFFEEEKQNQVWFNTIINDELVQQILSYGQDVEVLEPKELKLQLKTHIDNMKNYY